MRFLTTKDTKEHKGKKNLCHPWLKELDESESI